MEGESGEATEVLTRHLALLENVRYEAIPKEDTALHNIVDKAVSLYLSTLYKLK